LSAGPRWCAKALDGTRRAHAGAGETKPRGALEGARRRPSRARLLAVAGVLLLLTLAMSLRIGATSSSSPAAPSIDGGEVGALEPHAAWRAT